MKNLIIPTGYMNSGSSALTDLIREFEGYSAKYGSHEYVFLHTPNGLFDLEDKLLIGNNALRSDEALFQFEKTMQQLYDKKYWWVGHYNKTFGDDFLRITKAFTRSLTDVVTTQYWYYQENTNSTMAFKLAINKILRLLSFGKVTGKKPLLYSPMRLSLVTKEEFYCKSKAYLKNLFTMINLENEHLILDQLLLPHNLFRFENYFDDNAKVFVVDRDPRDIFFSNKYIHAKNNVSVPYPLDVDDFCLYYHKMRAIEKKATSPQILRHHFEDLIYKYDESLVNIMHHLALNPPEHVYKKQYFNPEISINNTQLFVDNIDYQQELAIIESKLADYLYDFPFTRKSNTKKIF